MNKYIKDEEFKLEESNLAVSIPLGDQNELTPRENKEETEALESDSVNVEVSSLDSPSELYNDTYYYWKNYPVVVDLSDLN